MGNIKNYYGLFGLRYEGTKEIESREELEKRNFLKSIDNIEIGNFLYKKKDIHPNVIFTYKETIEFIKEKLFAFGYDERSVNNYIKFNKTLLLYTVKDLKERLEIFEQAGVNISLIFANARFLYNFSNDIYKITLLYMNNNNIPLTSENIQESLEKILKVRDYKIKIKKLSLDYNIPVQKAIIINKIISRNNSISIEDLIDLSEEDLNCKIKQLNKTK